MKRMILSGMVACLLVALTLFVIGGTQATSQAPVADFGDAPDNDNGAGAVFMAYPDVPAEYPTVMNTINSGGPWHANPTTAFFLGKGVSGEEFADSGLDEDVDGNNLLITGTLAIANLDGYDDGLQLPLNLPHCQAVQLTFTVTVSDSYPTGTSAFANLWLDWDRNGRWGDTTSPCPGQSVGVAEWAVQNMPLAIDGPGVYHFTTSTFTSWHPEPAEGMWLRLTLAEAKTSANDGSGPSTGYAYGETEDYWWGGNQYATYVPLMMGGSTAEPTPDEPEVHIEENIPPDVIATWSIPLDDSSVVLPQDGLHLYLTNNSDETQQINLSLRMLHSGEKSDYRSQTLTLAPGEMMTHTLPASLLLPAIQAFRSPVLLQGEARVTNGSSSSYYNSEIPFMAFHPHGTNGDQLVAYNETGLERQMSAMQFDENETLAGRLSALIPAEESTANLSNLILYAPADGVLNESSQDPGTDLDFPPDPQSPPQITENGQLFVFTLCVEWYTAPIDNGFGEDYGTNDDGWRARGAKIRIWQSGNKIFDGFLNKYGCTYVSTNSTAGIYIAWSGVSRLESGGGYITVNHLSRVSNDIDDNASMSVWIDSVTAGAVYRPEMWNFDAMGILSYAIQERFSGGINGVTYYMKKAGCGNDPDKGSCATSIYGQPGIYMSSGQYRRKFIVGHEYGHRLLASVADYKNDCSYNGSGHGMTGLEYSSCAAMEGWAHFVAVAIWNTHSHTNGGSGNPDGIIVYWDGSNTVYSAETGTDQAYCLQQMMLPFLCSYFGYELDWMRHWWDYHTNPGTRPSHAEMFEAVDDASWSNGATWTSYSIESALPGNRVGRWNNYACWNAVMASTFCD